MNKMNTILILSVCIATAAVLSGCVERQLTINTQPQGAIVVLNDEEIGISPVTVNFNWYGDYNVRIQKEGFETLKTHRKLKGPWYDSFPFDFVAQILWPKTITNSYDWTFQLSPLTLPTREQLIKNAQNLKEQL